MKLNAQLPVGRPLWRGAHGHKLCEARHCVAGSKLFATHFDLQFKEGLVGAVHLKRQLAKCLRKGIAEMGLQNPACGWNCMIFTSFGVAQFCAASEYDTIGDGCPKAVSAE